MKVFDDVVESGNIKLSVREMRIGQRAVETFKTTCTGGPAVSIVGLDARRLKRRSCGRQHLSGRTTYLEQPPTADETLEIRQPLGGHQFAPRLFTLLDMRLDKRQIPCPIGESNHLRGGFIAGV